MATLSRFSKHPPLHRSYEAKSVTFGREADNRRIPGGIDSTRTSISFRDNFMPSKALERTSLEQAMKEMDISRSFVDGDSSDSSDSGEVPTTAPPVRRATSASVSSTMATHPSPVETPNLACSPLDVDTQAGVSDSRCWVLSKVGNMFDSRILSAEHVSDAIALAMLPDSTVDAMLSLLQSRPTLEMQAVFLRMWLEKRRIISTSSAPCEEEHVAVVKPRPERLLPAKEHSWVDEIASGIASSGPVFNTLRGSPPLCPTSLQFTDPMYHPVGLKRSITPSSGSTATPAEPA